MAEKIKKHTCPDRAGEKNMKAVLIKADEEKSELDKHNAKMLGKLIRMKNLRRGENETKWTEETFRKNMDLLLDWCYENEVELSIPVMRMWFNVSPRMFNYWKQDEKYGFIYDTIWEALDLIESITLSKIERYPVGNIFKLKSIHKYCDTQKIDITSNGKEIVSKDEINDLVDKLGLNK